MNPRVMLNKLDPARRALLLRRQQAVRAFSGHQLVANSLSACGITHVYGTTGSPVDQTFAACASKGLRVMGMRSQQGAMFAALAHNYVAGSLKAAVIVSAGPAVTNCTTGLSVALENGWPLVVIGGRQASSLTDPRVFQALDAASLFTPITRDRTQVAETEKIDSTIRWACARTMEVSPGPVYLDLSQEALEGRAAANTSPFEINSHPAEPVASDLQAAITILAQARRPALLIGKGLRWSGAEALLDQLTGALGIPFAASHMGRGYLPDSHALNFTSVRAAMLSNADAVLLVGARLDWTFRFGSEFPASTPVISINIDLVEAAKTANRGIALGVDARVGLQAIVDGLLEMADSGSPTNYDSLRLKDLDIARSEEEKTVQRLSQQESTPASPYHWMARLGKLLPVNAITIFDHGNTSLRASQALLAAETPVSRLTPGSNGCIGGGIPYAIGAKLANPERPVISVCGDFAAGLSLIELETMVRHRIPAIIIIINNSGIGGAVRQNAVFGRDYPEHVCQFQDGVRYDKIMEALGGTGIRVTRSEQIDDAFQKALDSHGPVLIDVITDPEFGEPPYSPGK